MVANFHNTERQAVISVTGEADYQCLPLDTIIWD
jgi:hypothetical protein